MKTPITIVNLINASTAATAAIAALAASTAMLLIFVILLFACKPFRNLFFHTDSKPSGNKKKQTKTAKSTKKAETTDKDKLSDDSAKAQKSSGAKKTKSGQTSPKTRVRLAYSDSVPTVPLFVAPKTTGKTTEEDIMKRTHEAFMSMTAAKPRAADTNDASDYVPTIVLPITKDKPSSNGTTNERPKFTTHERLNTTVRTGERTLTTHERAAINTATRSTTTAAKPTQTTAKTANAQKTQTAAKSATTQKTENTQKTQNTQKASAKTTFVTAKPSSKTTKKQ